MKPRNALTVFRFLGDHLKNVQVRFSAESKIDSKVNCPALQEHECQEHLYLNCAKTFCLVKYKTDNQNILRYSWNLSFFHFKPMILFWQKILFLVQLSMLCPLLPNWHGFCRGQKIIDQPSKIECRDKLLDCSLFVLSQSYKHALFVWDHE